MKKKIYFFFFFFFLYFIKTFNIIYNSYLTGNNRIDIIPSKINLLKELKVL